MSEEKLLEIKYKRDQEKKKEKKKSFSERAKKIRNNVMNFASNAVGATSAVKVGGNLVKNLTKKKGSKTIPLYKKGDYKSLGKDLVGIATLGSIARGALKLGAKGAAKGASKGASKVVSQSNKISSTQAEIIRQRIRNAQFLRKIGRPPMKY